MKKIIFLFAALCLAQAGTIKVTCAELVESTDLTAYSNVIYVAAVTMDPSVDGSETTLSICMNNTAEIRGFQFDLYLPEGMTAVKTSKGKFVVSLSEARLPEDDEHTLAVAAQGDGAIRFLCGSQYDETFTGTSGEIATIKVNVEGLAEGQYPITLKAMKLSETDITKFYTVDEVVTTFAVVQPHTIAVLEGPEATEKVTVNPNPATAGETVTLTAATGYKFRSATVNGDTPVTILDDKTVATFQMPTGDVTVDCDMVRDMSVDVTATLSATEFSIKKEGDVFIPAEGEGLTAIQPAVYDEIGAPLVEMHKTIDYTLQLQKQGESDDEWTDVSELSEGTFRWLLTGLGTYDGTMTTAPFTLVEEVTGIRTMSDVRSKMADAWYTLDGRKSDNKPAQKGVYINKGIKITIK